MSTTTEEKRDVLTRLDSLLARGQEVESGPNSVTSSSSTCSSTPSSILKTSKGTVKKKLSFPEDNIQEVIGYGGDDTYSSDEDDAGPPAASKRLETNETVDEMTTEEKNMLNLTRQNTTFNARPHNLNPDAPKLGVDKKVTPLITVRPFGQRNEVTPVHKVSPMINGELVEKDRVALNSDGGSTESSSSEEDFSSRPTSVLEKQFMKAKQSAASARLSFLNSTINTEANKGEATTDIVSNWVKSPEEEDEIDEVAKINKKKNVKLTRKSPYVVGPYASTAILKGTPKPSISVRKPPIPAKPEKLLASMSSASSTTSSTSSSSGCESPIAAPRRNYGEYEVTISDESRIDLSSTTSEASDEASNYAECYSVEADAKNEVIYDVTASSSNSSEASDVTMSSSVEAMEVIDEKDEDQQPSVIKELNEEPTSASDAKTSDAIIDTKSNVSNSESNTVTSLPKVQQNLASKNQLALEAIRKSLANKLSVQEELSKKEDVEDVQQVIVKASSNFEANRASIANALFSHHDKVHRPSIKKQQAPKPPPSAVENKQPNESSEAKDTTDSKSESAMENVSEVNVKDPQPSINVLEAEVPKQPPQQEVSTPSPPAPPVSETNTNIKPTIKSALSIKSDSSPKVKTVQFSPETMTMTLPNQEPDLISYNRWISRDPHGSPAIVESSFTGQPIAVQPPRPQVTHLNKKPVLQQPPTEDEIRKWTEKKRRSKSLPRGGSEIDEILGSSKTKPPSRLFPLMTPQPLPATVAPPVHRQSRVELYENERKKLRQSTKFQSIKKLFKLGSNPNLSLATGSGASPASGSSDATSAGRRNSISSSNNEASKFMDKDHEREILERDRSRLKPEILHPLDLQSGGVEVVTITPKSQTQALYEKNQQKSGNTPVKSKSIMKNSTATSKVEQDSKDSGHETSSIHTENSENESSSESSSSQSSGQVTHRDGIQHAGLSKNKLYSVGLHRAKPVPPPRSHSLEASSQAAAKKAEGERGGNACHLSENLAKNDENLMGETPQEDDEPISNKDEATNQESLPPNGYVVAGKMNLGPSAISVPPPNSAHLRRDFKKLMPPFRSESLSSGSSCLPHLQTLETESISERESISPLRLEPTDEDDSVKSGNIRSSKLGSRLSVRNGRSVVHKNLEDNYGAVISANHEALAQILEQTSQHHRPDVTKALKTLNSETLKWTDFTLIDEGGFVPTKAGSFHAATYGATKVPVTLLVSTTDTTDTSHKTDAFSLSPVSKFTEDSLPSEFTSSSAGSPCKGTISVFGRLQVETLESYTKKLANSVKMTSQAWEKEISFVLLQLINGLKSLQAQGIEEIEASLDQFLLIRADKDPHYRLMILNPITRGRLSLCACALASMLLLFQCDSPVDSALNSATKKPVLPELTPSVGMFRTMAEILQVESSMALGQVKSMLEYMLWGPSDIAFEISTSNQESREQALQRWLDLERATVLHNLIRTQGLWRIHLTVFEEYHLLFLVQTCAKMLHEASLLFESEVACM